MGILLQFQLPRKKVIKLGRHRQPIPASTIRQLLQALADAERTARDVMNGKEDSHE